MSLSEALMSLCPGAQWSAVGEDYATVVWHVAPETIPTQAEIDAESARLIAEKPRKKAEANRAAAYRLESDPLFFKAQRGEATINEWTAKVAEIKARFPYPGGEE